MHNLTHNEHDHGASIPWAARACPLLLLLLLLLMPLGCSSPSASPERDSELGTLEIDLTAPDQTGRRYRLRDAQFFVTPIFGEVDGGPFRVVLSSESAPDAERITERLLPGSYRMELQPGWRMEEVTAAAVDVSAVLLSDAAVSFGIRRFSTTFVNYQFGVDGEALAFGGDLSIGITVISADAGATSAD